MCHKAMQKCVFNDYFFCSMVRRGSPARVSDALLLPATPAHQRQRLPRARAHRPLPVRHAKRALPHL